MRKRSETSRSDGRSCRTRIDTRVSVVQSPPFDLLRPFGFPLTSVPFWYWFFEPQPVWSSFSHGNPKGDHLWFLGPNWASEDFQSGHFSLRRTREVEPFEGRGVGFVLGYDVFFFLSRCVTFLLMVV